MSVHIDKGSALATISLTPLIDVVFLLLIFFLVATKFAEEERELDVVLPEASEAQPLTSVPKEIFVNVVYYVETGKTAHLPDDQKLRYFVTGKMLNLTQLEQVLKQAWVNNPGRQTVVVRADERCQYKHVIAAKNACLKANIRDIRETTRQAGG